MTKRRIIGLGAIALVVVTAVIVAYLVFARGTDDAPTRPTGESAPDGLDSFYSQELDWEDCGTDQCASVEVPVDYAEPDGETLELRVKMREADDEASERRLFINPGGPGGSGIEYVQQFAGTTTAEVREAYDIVGFDPRGVGESTPLECLDDEAFDEFINTDPSPDDAGEEQEYADQLELLGEACVENSGDLVNHVSTIEVARDLDVLRAVFGQEELAYFGASYGTSIGGTYAELFTDKVGPMVLDGAVDPTLDGIEGSLGQAEGFQRALTAYVGACVDGPDCPLGDDADEGLDVMTEFLDDLDSEPLPALGGRELTQAMGVYGIAVAMYNRDFWPTLTSALAPAVLEDNGAGLLILADAYFRRDAGAGFTDNSGQVIYSVNCLDEPSNLSIDEVRALEDEFLDVAPVLGRFFAWGGLNCTEWPGESSEEPVTVEAEGASPIVVVGTTRDPATPYEWSEALAEQLESGVLITREGDGHTGYRAGSACVDEAVDAYLLEGTVPEDGLTCQTSD